MSCDVARDDGVLLFVSSSGHGKRTPVAAFNRQGRGGQGVRGMRVTEARGVVVAAFTVAPGDEILVFSSAGNLVRMGVDEISEQGRDATGVRVARLDEGDTVVAVARVLEGEQSDDETRRPARSPEHGACEGGARVGSRQRRPRARARRKRRRKRTASPQQVVYERRYRQTVRSVDLWSVLKISLCFYLCALIVMLVAGVVLWWIASAVGAVAQRREASSASS